MRTTLLMALCFSFIASPAQAGERGTRTRAPKVRTVSKAKKPVKVRLGNLGKAIARRVSGLRDGVVASAQVQKLLLTRGHEKVTYLGEEMTLRQAYSQAKREYGVGFGRATTYSTGAFTFATAGLTALAASEALTRGMEMGVPLTTSAGATLLGTVATVGLASYLNRSVEAARRDMLKSAKAANMTKLPKTALSHYGVIE